MKKLFFYPLLAIFCLSVLSCQKEKDKVNEATEFDLNYSTTLPIPSGSVVSTNTSVPVEFTTPEIATNSSTRFASEKTTKELISEIKFTRFRISTNTGNLDFLKSISIIVQTNGLSDQAIATKTLIPQGVTSVDADLGDVNIKEYIFKDNIRFKVSITVNSIPGQSQDLKLEQTLRVKGKKI